MCTQHEAGRQLTPLQDRLSQDDGGIVKNCDVLPLIKSLELTFDDCVLREHNEYMKLLQPRGDGGAPLQPPAQLLQMVEKSMQIVDDGVCVRREGHRKHCTRAAYENLDKISKKMQDVR